MLKPSKSAIPLVALLLLAACSGDPFSASPGPARIVLNSDSPRPTIEVVDVSGDQLRALPPADAREAWAAILRVATGPDQPAMVGNYEVAGGRIVFTPMFPLDRGRPYYVRFLPPGAADALTASVSLPAPDMTPTTVVSDVFPSAEVVPENQLRFYIHFSSPMGSRGGLDYIHLFDETGAEVRDPFLPLDAEFFNDDRTRYTVFFDPGRQKRGIPVIEGMGRSLTEGKSYTLVVDAKWRDGQGLPLKQPFKRTFTVGPPDDKPLDPQAWNITAPAAGTMGPLVVIFPEPLDRGLLLRALGVLGPGGKPIDGQVAVGAGELTWTFAPKDAWQAGDYNMVAFAMLEDLAGNRIGRAFEVDQFDRADTSSEPEKTLIPFAIR